MIRAAGLLVVSGADLATTLVGLARGAHESAPLASMVLGADGAAGLIALTIAAVGIELAVLRAMPRFRTAGWLLCIGLGLIPVLNNVAVLARALTL